MFYLSDRVSQPDGPHAIQFSKTRRSLALPVSGSADKTGISGSQHPRDARVNWVRNLAEQARRSRTFSSILTASGALLAAGYPCSAGVGDSNLCKTPFAYA